MFDIRCGQYGMTNDMMIDAATAMWKSANCTYMTG